MIKEMAQAAELLEGGLAGVVILERLARGGGTTNWWHVRTASELEAVAEFWRPGSLVSLYFDDRISEREYYNGGRQQAMSILNSHGEVCLGIRGVDGLTINMDFIAGPNDLADFEATLGQASTVFVGSFPSRASDGTGAMTFVIPDEDGITRTYPY